MADKCCRSCDGRGERKATDKENVFKVTVSKCSACNGTGRTPEPSKSGKRGFFRRAPKCEDDNNDLDRAADKFLARHGFGKGGR